MNSESTTFQFPTNLYQLVEETFKIYEEYKLNNCDNMKDNSYANCLILLLKKYHLWPFMKVKKFKGRSDIVLLHNTYLRKNVDNFKELYEQCRSVVLDFSLNCNNNIAHLPNNGILEPTIATPLTIPTVLSNLLL